MKSEVLQLLQFTATLSTTDWRELMPEDIAKIDAYIGSDGCTGVSQAYRSACVIHDFWYRTHFDFNLKRITRRIADERFRRLIQDKSKFSALSPMSWWRWLGVRLAGRKAWKH